MNYSVIAPEFLAEEEITEDQLLEVEIDGITLEVKMNSMESGEVVRIISSNPNDYLLSDYQPGNNIKLKPVIE
ncbi:YlzJ-like family protein [Natroniella sulfidigena]|uniref:YlzJ-like family protein n=1 Tax=Natroniella sulfidigena TaxID=723921 RepID=UPI00200B2E7C|nr:YlzJ-like family protein [Natroniella sulfidigena]MCK8816457.1 YlzJ-like family protein [Natroniella sulfidigena]